MALIVLPDQFVRRAELFHQLGSLLSAGLPALRALEQLAKHPPARGFRAPLRRVVDLIGQGESFTRAFEKSGTWLTSFDLALLDASERSGRIDAACRILAEYYRERARLAKQMISAMAYPVFVLGFALFIFPINQFTGLVLRGEVLPFFLQKGIVFGVLAGVPLGLIWAVQGKRGEKWRGLLETLCRPVPFLGKARHQMALARLCTALEALINAGVSIIEAWSLAAAASGSPRIEREVRTWPAQLEMGRTPAELVQEATVFPDMFQSMYAGGEISGQQDDVLLRLRTHYAEEGSRNLQLVTEWTPRLAYLVIVVYVAFQIVGFYSNYFAQVSQ
jgi:type II secretory pathway component PulF